jgi:rubrerythrin
MTDNCSKCGRTVRYYPGFVDADDKMFRDGKGGFICENCLMTWDCRNCGYVYSEIPPDRICPHCGFKEVEKK